MQRISNLARRGQSGFTLIELLILVAIIGILVSVILPSVYGFTTAGRLNAANSELNNILTAAIGYYGEHQEWPPDTMAEGLDVFYSGELKATYHFNTATGRLTGATDNDWGSDIYLDVDEQQWVVAT
ncbi:type II secretion system protein [Chloroflexota bacterium]